MPEVGALPGAPERLHDIKILEEDFEYAPVGGLIELRTAVADFYNRNFRKDKTSKYTWENIAISGGGRASLTRLVASLGNINLGHFLPDYTALRRVAGYIQFFYQTNSYLIRTGQ